MEVAWAGYRYAISTREDRITGVPYWEVTSARTGRAMTGAGYIAVQRCMMMHESSSWKNFFDLVASSHGAKAKAAAQPLASFPRSDQVAHDWDTKEYGKRPGIYDREQHGNYLMRWLHQSVTGRTSAL